MDGALFLPDCGGLCAARPCSPPRTSACRQRHGGTPALSGPPLSHHVFALFVSFIVIMFMYLFDSCLLLLSFLEELRALC